MAKLLPVETTQNHYFAFDVTGRCWLCALAATGTPATGACRLPEGNRFARHSREQVWRTSHQALGLAALAGAALRTSEPMQCAVSPQSNDFESLNRRCNIDLESLSSFEQTLRQLTVRVK